MAIKRLESFKEFKERTGLGDSEISRRHAIDISRMKLWRYGATPRGKYAFNVGTDEVPEFVEISSCSPKRDSFSKENYVLCIEG